jgi:hypothetical protein
MQQSFLRRKNPQGAFPSEVHRVFGMSRSIGCSRLDQTSIGYPSIINLILGDPRHNRANVFDTGLSRSTRHP